MNNFLNYIPTYIETISAPEFIFVSLYIITLLFHIIFVNLTIGCTASILVSKYIYKVYNDNDYNIISNKLANLNTINISLTITTGVAPLLFIQVLYDKLFYTSSILIAYYWLFILIAIIIAYYLFYIYKYKPFYLKYKPFGGTIYIFIAFILFMYVAFILVSNTLISLNPHIWPNLQNSINFNIIPTLLPRYLHFILAALAFNGIFICIYANYNKTIDNNIREKLYNLGKNMFIYTTITQFIIGPWFLLSHKKEILYNVLTGTGTIYIAIAILLSIVLIYLLIKKKSIILISIISFIVLTLMILLRRLIEVEYLKPLLESIIYKTDFQLTAFIMFLVLFLGALIFLIFLLRTINKKTM
ncbi:MAG: hypothetical protein SVN78_10155 [Deferribacterota bacterium]|nr:hypothetical protein [Deferribacterota bacterium]